MSLTSCEKFLREVQGSDELGQQLKAMTAAQEIVRLAHRHGYTFDIDELMMDSSRVVTVPTQSRAVTVPKPPETTTFYHHEYDLTELPGFEPVITDLGLLKTMPPTVLTIAIFDSAGPPFHWSTASDKARRTRTSSNGLRLWL